jgi:hypothetical protein
MVMVVCALAAIVLAMLLMLPALAWGVDEVPAIFKITSITHTDEKTLAMNYDSRVVVQNTGATPYQNADLMAKFFKNDDPVRCTISTLHGEDFIPTHHYGIQTISGEGCKGVTWLPGERVAFDFTDRTFFPGDLVRVEISDVITGEILSIHSYTA